MLAAALGLSIEVREATHETIARRRASCHLPNSTSWLMPSLPTQQSACASGSRPSMPKRGSCGRWRRFWNGAPQGHMLVVGHGAVGTLLLCHYRQIPISRAHDQPAGGGNYFTVLRSDRRVLQSWRPMEQTTIRIGPRRAVSPACALALDWSGHCCRASLGVEATRAQRSFIVTTNFRGEHGDVTRVTRPCSPRGGLRWRLRGCGHPGHRHHHPPAF
jgi:hypothetical protein